MSQKFHSWVNISNRNEHLCPPKDMSHSIFTQNSAELEITQKSINIRLGKHIVTCLYMECYAIVKKEWITESCNYINESHRHNVE